MTTDKNEPSESSASNEGLRGNDKHAEAPTKSSRAFEPQKDHYEPEAHHEWFPSERFFFAWTAVGCCGFITLAFALIAHHIFHAGYQPGDRAERDIVATHAIVVPDDIATRAARDKARQSVMPVFKPDRSNDQSTLTTVSNKLKEIAVLQKAGLTPIAGVTNLTPGEHAKLLWPEDGQGDTAASQQSDELTNIKARLSAKSPTPTGDLTKLAMVLLRQRQALAELAHDHPNLDKPELTVALSVPPADWAKFAQAMESATTRICRVFSRLPVADPQQWNETAVEFMPDSWSADLRQAASQLVCSTMAPNVAIDESATQTKATHVANEVKPIMKRIAAGELIVARKGIISQDAIKVMQAMGISDANRVPIMLGLCISLAAAVALVALFLYTYEAKHLFSMRSLGLMYTLAIVTLATANLVGKTYPQAVPLPAAALLLTIFFGQRAAIAITLPLAIFIAVDRMADFNNLVALGTAAGAAIGTYNKRRHALMSTGLVIGMAQAFGFLAALAISQTPLTATSLGPSLGMEFLCGILSSIVAIGTLPFLENIFGLATPFRLAELTDADQPLLRRLEEDAPGTYQHSLAVANLAEAGARAIGADVNLVRAGAYYHDIGKMMRPRFFIENQLGATNPHDSMTPEESRERVLAHVTDGLVLAKEYQLPKAVQDFIPMHQGTSLMAYFFHKACLRDGAENVDAQSYRYPGPKPQSKETSIVMLADVSEAVTHAMKDPTESEVDTAIAKVFQNRWDDGQFNESGLTNHELQKVKKAFVRVWRTLHHERLKYPSTTTGKMAVPPDNLPSASSLANTVTKAEFSVEPVQNEEKRQPPNGTAAGAKEPQAESTGETKIMAGEAPETASGDNPSCC